MILIKTVNCVIQCLITREFPKTDIKAQMRQDGICDEDIELAVSIIDELGKGGGRMAKYIDAEALKNKLISSGAICDFGQYLIDIQPAADVRPERHGEWLWLDDGFYECPECGAFASAKNPFCWKCGAKARFQTVKITKQGYKPKK